jgi:transglutaminase-like putative cysteine protease
MSNDLYPFVSNDVWIDREGNTVQESVRDGMIVTRAVDEASGRKFLAEAAVAKSDLVLDFSLIRLEPPLKRQKELKGLVVEFDRIPVGIELPQGVAQKVEHAGSALRVRTATDSAADSPEASIPPIGDELATSDRIQSDNQEIIALGKDIVAKETDPVKMVALLARWVDRNVEDAVIDSHSALETLRIRKGNCQSHTRLYTAFARSLGIPTRFVSGLVHVEGKGFLYHSWAESFVGRWITVDPTFGQIPADATHVKIVTGESADAMAALAGIIGRITARVVETTY